MKPRVKICGITNSEDAALAVRAGADALGFIFYEKSPRYITPQVAASIIQHLPPFITPVGVFVNAAREFIEEVIRTTTIRAIQLSGEETPDDCTGYSVSVIKSFRIRKWEEVESVKRFTIAAAMLDGAKDGQYGGSGDVADFTIGKEIRKFHPLILAGGLNPDNVIEAVRAVQPYA
ncbi:MAG: phosphoribosylanthranilate isomerase, partial [Ignavibacteriae bacterium]|nr:phosphoribosylanthranilate isomerase [Ignavibacteriota bacterium]